MDCMDPYYPQSCQVMTKARTNPPGGRDSTPTWSVMATIVPKPPTGVREQLLTAHNQGCLRSFVRSDLARG